ncbi:MAG: UDP-N-acetylmuramoyl-tripeptide--D-alanyl-D-alanine ligase [Treponema sp.]|jgi:UDP-N-acetylmuramoyl-tripeptide--D-alanyl-D-alanine ligase|nr:UDP-N-acetylmuramoyl-tripeptide--D-alanyl-D-alanine ligase [Treponema sp.]
MDELLMDFAGLSRSIGARLVSLCRDDPYGEGDHSAGGSKKDGEPCRGFSSVAIDSRMVRPGALFVALKGTVQDGHRYVEAAFKAGAAAALVARSCFEDPAYALAESARKAGGLLLVVEDTLRGLQDAAAAYLNRFPELLRIGITGSAGKTTTKEIAAAMIGREKAVVLNPGNLNSETGLPLAVFEVRPCHRVGVFEIGMNRRGEIGELAAVLKPRIALITNIGSAHIGMFGSKEAIAREKKDIFSYFLGTETALIPEDEAYRDFLAADIRGKVLFYGPRVFKELGEIRDRGLEGTEIIWDGTAVSFSLPGAYNLRNALAAAAIAREVPVSAAAIREGLALTKPLFGRSEILKGAVTVIRDCYNANPESTEEAVALCDSLSWPGRRVYVIGSMLELGDCSGEAHERLGRFLAASRADRIYLYGKETRAAAEVLERTFSETPASYFYTDSMEELSRSVGDYIRPGDLVLLKGSRGCALEKLTGVLTRYEVESRQAVRGKRAGKPGAAEQTAAKGVW